MSPKITRVRTAVLYPDCFQGVQHQVRLLGDSLSEADVVAYLASNGPACGFAPEGLALNPNRPKAWHLGRVKFFRDAFRTGQAVERIKATWSPLRGYLVEDGYHRVLGAFFAGLQDLEVEVI